jgi:hypothetical protein
LTFRDFVCLYIAEGYKRNRNVVSICNSDPAVVQLATLWMSRLTERKREYSIQYHADQNPDELREFWSGMQDTLFRARLQAWMDRLRLEWQ